VTAALPPPSSPPAGWYPDPHQPAAHRYFDGRTWTGYTAPAFAAAREPHRRLPIVAAVGAICTLLISLITSRILLHNLVQFRWPIVVYVAISVVVGYGPSVWWCRYATQRWGSGSRRDDLGLHVRGADLGWGPLVWLSATFAEVAFAVVVIALHIPFTSNITGVRQLRLDHTYVVSLLVTAVVAAPLVEETVFRGLILPGFLSRMHPAVAIGAQGVLFGAAHIDPARGAGNIGLVVILGAVGVVFGGAAYLTRRIAATMIAHAILNAVVLTVALLR
jgi:membrane protease YdiL (CAAX protease family)